MVMIKLVSSATTAVGKDVGKNISRYKGSH